MTNKLVPKLFTAIKEGYDLSKFLKDLNAGIIVGIVALPLAIAFGIASGVNPEQGLYTAIIAGFLISFFSGSRFQIGGPTGAFIIIIYRIVEQYGYEGLAISTIMAGIILVIAGFIGLGNIIKYIPYPVTIGFTSGIALLIFVTQIKDFMGIQTAIKYPSEFFHKIIYLVNHFNKTDMYSFMVGLSTILIIVFFPKINKKIPPAIFALVSITVLVKIFDIPVETVGDRFGEVKSEFPKFYIPGFNLNQIQLLLPSAITIAFLGGIESLLSAVVADGMTGRKHRSNMELIGQGVANIVCPFFFGIPATGAIARTATNIKNNGQTPIAGIIHAMTLLIILVFLGKWAALIPMSVLAGILMIVAYYMSEWHLFLKMLKSPKSDISVLLITFFLTVLLDLTVAIEAGIILSGLLFMKRMSEVTSVDYLNYEIDETDSEYKDDFSVLTRKVPDNVQIFEINGPFFFGAAEKFSTFMSQMNYKPDHLIVRMRNVPAIDATGIKALEDFLLSSKESGIKILITGINKQPMLALKRSGLIDLISEENIYVEIDSALKSIEK